MKSMTEVYVYHFGYKGKNSHTHLDTNNYPPKVSKNRISRKLILNHSIIIQIIEKSMEFGVGNGDDLIYLFPILSGTFRPLPHEDLVFSQRFIKLLTTFVADGQPYLEMESGHQFVWNPVKATNATHLNIGKSNSGP